MTGPAPTAAEPRLRLLKKALMWAALLVLFWLLFRLVPPAEVIDQFRLLPARAIAGLAGLSLVFILGVCLIDATAVWYAWRRLSPAVGFGPVLSVRTATMLLASLVTLVGQAGIAAHLARKYKLPPGPSAGMIMLLVLIEVQGMAAVSLLSLAALAAAGRLDAIKGAPLEIVVLLCVGSWSAFILLVAVGKRLRPGPRLTRWRVAGILGPLQTLTFPELLVLIGLKTLLATWQIGLSYYAFIIYGLKISPAEMFVIMPATIIVSSVPITPARLATTQFSWTFFFSHLIPPAALVAFSLLFQFTLNVARWLIGAFALALNWREFFPPTGKQP